MQHTSAGSRIFDGLNYMFLGLMVVIAGIPFLYVLSGSLVPQHVLDKHAVVLIPYELTWDAYKYIFMTDTIPKSLWNSIVITLVGTLFNLVMTAIMAYPLARKTIYGRKLLMFMVVFTMLFHGGLIPSYLVVKELGLLNSYGALWLPGAISAFNLILLKNFFQELPDGLEESAKIDGANDFQIFSKIVLPLSKPALATFALFYAVGYWNNYFSAVIYLDSNKLWPVQVWLRQIVILAAGGFGDASGSQFEAQLPPETLKLAVIVVATLPVLLVYPFIQRYFTKGILLGSVKG
jgi:putative aldouronate transport system permease protein